MQHPAPPECLTRSYAARAGQLGGTLIAEDVVDRDEHRRRLTMPDGYRPVRCPACGHDRLHAHDFRERYLRGESERETFRRYRCAECRAVWLVLAGFMARHLHRSWAYVEASTGVVEPADDRRMRTVAARTLRRWLVRLLSCARVVVQAFTTAGVALGGASESRSRRELLAEVGR